MKNKKATWYDIKNIVIVVAILVVLLLVYLQLKGPLFSNAEILPWA